MQRLGPESSSRDLEDIVDKLVEHSSHAVSLAFDKVVASLHDPIKYKLPESSSSLERVLLDKVKKLPQEVKTKLTERGVSRLNADSSARARTYGIFADIHLAEPISVFEKATQYQSHPRVQPLAAKFKALLDQKDERSPKSDAGEMRQNDKAEDGIARKRGQVERRAPKVKHKDLDIDGVGAYLDRDFEAGAIPTRLELYLKKVTCVQETYNELGKDNMRLATVTHDIYSDVESVPQYIELGKFKTGQSTAYDKLVASFDFKDGFLQDSSYGVSLYLAEKDILGFKHSVEELHGMSSREMRDFFILAYSASIFSLLGFSRAAKDGREARGVLKGLSIGLGPLLWYSSGMIVMGGLPGLACVGMLFGTKLMAVICTAIGESIMAAIRDDMFPAQAIGFHYGDHDNVADVDSNAVASADLGGQTQQTIEFRWKQNSLRKGIQISGYDLEFEWRTVLGDGSIKTPEQFFAETDDAIEAKSNLDKIQNIGILMLENRSFHQMLGYLANDRGRLEVNGKTTHMFNRLAPKTADQICPDEKCTLAPESANFFAQGLEVPVTALDNTAIAGDPGHSVINVERQINGSTTLISIDNPDTLDDPGTQDIENARDGNKFDPHWPDLDKRNTLACNTNLFLTADESAQCSMVGFVADYFAVLAGRQDLVLQNLSNPKPEDFINQEKQLREIMGYYPASKVPTFDILASEFAICDSWYSSYPGNTWVNRTIAMTGAPGKQTRPKKDAESNSQEDQIEAIENDPEHAEHIEFIVDNDMPFDEKSFFRILDEQKYNNERISWATYSQDMPSLLVVDASYASEFRNRINGQGNRLRPMDRFFEDAQKGELPQVFWIDPNFMDMSDMRENLLNWEPSLDKNGHFSSGFIDNNTANDDHPPTDITHGQHFVLEIFDALKNSPQWRDTLLIVVYDEHGGFFDPVVPPYLAQPESPAFKSLGARVPALIVSPYVSRQLVSHTKFDHASIMKTVLTKFCSSEDGTLYPDVESQIGERVRIAEHLGRLLTVPEESARFVAEADLKRSRSKAKSGKNVDKERVKESGKVKNAIFGGLAKHHDRRATLSMVVDGARSTLQFARQIDIAKRKIKKPAPTDLQLQFKVGRDTVFDRIVKTEATTGVSLKTS